jgi:hypothetical protein
MLTPSVYCPRAAPQDRYSIPTIRGLALYGGLFFVLNNKKYGLSCPAVWAAQVYALPRAFRVFSEIVSPLIAWKQLTAANGTPKLVKTYMRRNAVIWEYAESIPIVAMFANVLDFHAQSLSRSLIAASAF